MVSSEERPSNGCMYLKAKRISRSAPIIIHSLMLSFHFVFKGSFLPNIFVRWHESEYFVQKITNRINSDLLRFPPMKQPQPGGCIRRQIKNLGQYQPSPLYKNPNFTPLIYHYTFLSFWQDTMMSVQNIKVFHWNPSWHTICLGGWGWDFF